ncbi:hypothetical protein IU477_29165, partial [Nocardia cyriacigeorgica]|nr:hypothetical protein [Nocardia cyriacigeorgica]
QAAAEIGMWRDKLAQIPHGDRAQWAWMAGQAAGVFAAWSETFEGDKPGAFAAAAQELTRSAQVQRRADRYRPPRPVHSHGFGDAARLLLGHSGGAMPRSHAQGQARAHNEAAIAAALLALLVALLLLAIAIALEIARAHRARGELGRALSVEHMTRAHLDPVRAQWETELDERRFQWDRDAADVFAAAAGRTAQRAIEQTTAHVEPPSDPAPEQPARKPWSDKAVAAARGPLTPPPAEADTNEARERSTRRVYYTELSRADRSVTRIAAISNVAFADRDIAPRQWPDAMLDEELTHLRTEVQLLADEIADRRTGEGPLTREAIADNAELTRRAEKIADAQQARKAADDTARAVEQLTAERTRLEQELENTSRLKVRARAKLQAQVDDTTDKLAALTKRLPAARAAAQAAAEATDTPVHEWNDVLVESDERRQRQRVAEARNQDQRDLAEDTQYLHAHLQNNLRRVEAEHARRAKLTPEQRAREARTQTRKRTAGPKISPDLSTGPTPHLPYQPPEHGRDNDHGFGR